MSSSGRVRVGSLLELGKISRERPDTNHQDRQWLECALEIYITNRGGAEQSGIKLFCVIPYPFKDAGCSLSSLGSGPTY